MADLRYLIDFTSNTLGLDRATSAVGKLSAVLAAVGVGVAAVKLKNFFSDAIEGAAEFEQQLATVQAVSGATAEEMGRIKLASEDLGKSTRYNSTQAAEGFEILARAGLDVDASLKTIPSVLALAQGNALGLGEAAGFVTKTVQGMGLSFDDSGRVADVLAKAAASANTDVRGLGSALSYAAPSAAALGVSVEEAAAYIGKFADAGIDSSRAGTAFNSMLSQFGNDASSFKRELVKAGITTNDFNEAIRQLAAKGADGQKAINALGLEAGPALKALLSQGVGSLDDLTAKLNEAGGTAAEQAEIMNNTWQGALASLGSAWQYLKDTLGESFLDSMTGSFGDLSKVITDLVDSGKIKQLGDSVATVFSEATAFVIDFVENVDFAEIIDKVSNSFEYLGTIATGVNGAFQVLSIVFVGLKARVLSIGVAVSMVVTIWTELVKVFVDGGGAIAKLFGGTSEAIDGFSESLQGTLDAAENFRNFATDEIEAAGESIGKSFNSIAGNADKSAKSTEESGGTIAEVFKGITESAFEGAQETGKSLEQIRKDTAEMINSFSTPEEFAELLKVITDSGQIATVGSEQVNRLIIGAGGLVGKHKEVVEGANQSMKDFGMTAEGVAEKTKKAISATFASLGIDVGQSLDGVNSKTREVFDGIATGAKDVGESTYTAAEKAKLLAALFEKGLGAAKTKEEFKELNEIIKFNGLSSVVTAEQQKTLQAGMKGGADAANAAAQATISHTQSLDNNTVSTAQNSGAIRANTAERKQQSISVWNAKFATDEATKSESSSLAFMQKAEAAIKSKIAALNQLSGSTATADESYKKLMKSMGFVDGYKWASMADYARDMERVNKAVDKQAESYSEKNNKHKRDKGSNYTSDTMPEARQTRESVRQQSNTSTDTSVRTINVNLQSSSGTVNATIPASQEAMFERLMKELQDSKAIAGY